jgi:hypothetical protein
VPDVTDFVQTTAAAAISKVGLIPRFTTLGGGIGLRVVVAQRPVGGTVVPSGTVVLMTLGLEGGIPQIGGGTKPLFEIP